MRPVPVLALVTSDYDSTAPSEYSTQLTEDAPESLYGLYDWAKGSPASSPDHVFEAFSSVAPSIRREIRYLQAENLRLRQALRSGSPLTSPELSLSSPLYTGALLRDVLPADAPKCPFCHGVAYPVLLVGVKFEYCARCLSAAVLLLWRSKSIYATVGEWMAPSGKILPSADDVAVLLSHLLCDVDDERALVELLCDMYSLAPPVLEEVEEEAEEVEEEEEEEAVEEKSAEEPEREEPNLELSIPHLTLASSSASLSTLPSPHPFIDDEDVREDIKIVNLKESVPLPNAAPEGTDVLKVFRKGVDAVKLTHGGKKRGHRRYLAIDPRSRLVRWGQRDGKGRIYTIRGGRLTAVVSEYSKLFKTKISGTNVVSLLISPEPTDKRMDSYEGWVHFSFPPNDFETWSSSLARAAGLKLNTPGQAL